MHYEIWNCPRTGDGPDHLVYFTDMTGTASSWSYCRADAKRYRTLREALLAYDKINDTAHERDRVVRVTKRYDIKVWPLSPLEQLAILG